MTDIFSPTRYGAAVRQTGEKIELCTSARSGDGKFRFVWTLAPGKRGPNEHYHSRDNEIGEVVSGHIRVWLDDAPKDYGPGDILEIPRGVRHRFYNYTSEPVVVRVAYDGTEMEDTFAPLAVNAYPSKPGMRHFARMLVYLLENKPTVPSSKWEIRMMSAIARTLRRFGVRAHQPVHGWDRDAAA
jgi:quercetin dioxygenase-like cupin family protein